MFAIISDAEGKCSLPCTHEAAKIISLVHSDAWFAEESPVLVLQGRAGCQRRCGAGPCVAGCEPQLPAAPAACWPGQWGEWEGSGWLESVVVAEEQRPGFACDTDTHACLLAGWEERQRRLVWFIPLRHPWWVQCLWHHTHEEF